MEKRRRRRRQQARQKEEEELLQRVRQRGQFPRELPQGEDGLQGHLQEEGSPLHQRADSASCTYNTVFLLRSLLSDTPPFENF